MLCGGKVVDFVDMAGIFANFVLVCGPEGGGPGGGGGPGVLCFCSFYTFPSPPDSSGVRFAASSFQKKKILLAAVGD